MLWLTEDAHLVCVHRGNVKSAYSQNFVTIHHRKLLVRPDPEMKPIALCPNYAGVNEACLLTEVVQEGYSNFIRIDGKQVCLDTVTGFTNGTPPGLFKYFVQSPGQNFVAQR